MSLRIVFFVTGGEMGYLPLRAVADRHEIVAVVRPAYGGRRIKKWARSLAEMAGLRPKDPIARWVHDRGVRALGARSGNDPDVVSQVRALRPDLICIATFPLLLRPELFTIPRFGAINLHSSLLPRHRGPTPLFWVYHDDDRQTGVTLHLVNERADAGEILFQDSYDLPRGYSVDLLHRKSAERGALLLSRTVDALESGDRLGIPQNESLATHAPRVKPGTRMVDFEKWDVERVWHFLAGLCPRFHEPLTVRNGQPISYEKVLGYERTIHHLTPGRLERAPQGWMLFCRGGVVLLDKGN
jgi:methionyl-tRNA formyltransferase